MTAPTSVVELYTTATVLDGTGTTISTGANVVARVSDVTLDGVVLAELFTSDAQRATSLAAGEIDADTSAAIIAIYLQNPTVTGVLIIRVAGAGDYGIALTNAEVAGFRAPWDYQTLVIDDRAATATIAVATWCETRRVLFIFQSSDADWLTAGGLPAAYAAGATLATRTKTAGLYEDTDATQADAMWAGRIAGINPVLQRAASMIRVAGLSEYTTFLTAPQRGFLGANNCNFHFVITPQGTTRAIISDDASGGLAVPQVMDGSASVALIRTIDYIEVDIIVAMGELLDRLLALGLAIPANDAGKAMILGELATEVFTPALQAGYITADVDLGLPYGYALTVTFGAGATPTATVTGQVVYLGEVANLAVTVTLVS